MDRRSQAYVVRQPALVYFFKLFLWTGDFGLQEFAKWDTRYLLCDFNNWKQINVEKLKEAWCSSTCVHWAAAEDQLQTVKATEAKDFIQLSFFQTHYELIWIDVHL